MLFGQPLHSPWDQLQELQSEMNRLLNVWSEDAQKLFTTYPAINMWEEGDHVVVVARVPGLKLEDLEIFVTGDNQLTIQGERKPWAPEKSRCLVQQRAHGKFLRALPLPYPVDHEKVEARLEQGVLHLRLAKHESARPRRIQVKAG